MFEEVRGNGLGSHPLRQIHRLIGVDAASPRMPQARALAASGLAFTTAGEAAKPFSSLRRHFE
jgi:hypothetical protein